MASAMLSGLIIIPNLPPANPSINVVVTEKGGIFQNYTISCRGCVANGKYVWQALITIPTITPFTVSAPLGESTFLKYFFGLGVSRIANSPCPSGIENAQMCVYPTLPISIAQLM